MTDGSRDPMVPVNAAIAALLTLAIGWTLASALHFGPVDDAYISLRYAVNWADGHGLSFNPGERVEGYTNFLWVALLALAVRVGIDPVLALVTLGWASLAACAFAVAHFAGRHLPGLPPWGAIGLAVAACTNTAVVAWGSSGMEACLFGALILGAADAALGDKRAPWFAALWLTLAAMTRPEAAALVPAISLGVWWSRRSVREVAQFLAAFALLFGAYFAARWVYFGYPFPNTFYAKLDYGDANLTARGLAYLGRFALAAWPLVVPAFAGVAWSAARSAPVWTRTLAGTALLFAGVVAYEGGDHFAFFRFLVPIVPLLALLAWLPLSRNRVTTAAAIGLLVLASVVVGLPEHHDGLGMSHLDRHAAETQLAQDWSEIGRFLGDRLPPGTSVVTIAIGAVGYHSGLYVVDPHGLTDPVIAHREVELGTGYPGHEKFDVEYVLQKRPDVVLLVNLPTPGPIPPQRLAEMIWGEFNTELLAHPQFARDYEYRPVAMAPGRVLNLHLRR